MYLTVIVRKDDEEMFYEIIQVPEEGNVVANALATAFVRANEEK